VGMRESFLSLGILGGQALLTYLTGSQSGNLGGQALLTYLTGSQSGNLGGQAKVQVKDKNFVNQLISESVIQIRHSEWSDTERRIFNALNCFMVLLLWDLVVLTIKTREQFNKSSNCLSEKVTELESMPHGKMYSKTNRSRYVNHETKTSPYSNHSQTI